METPHPLLKPRIEPALVAQEPFATPSNWPLGPSGSAIEGDMDRYIETMSSFITQQGCSYCSNSYDMAYGGRGDM